MALGMVAAKRRSGKPRRWYSEMAMKERSWRSDVSSSWRGGVGRAVQRGDHGRAEQAGDERAHGAPGKAVVVVDDVELARPRVGRQAVHDLDGVVHADALERGAG